MTGLFHQAILQSGTELDYWVLHTPPEQPSYYLRQVHFLILTLVYDEHNDCACNDATATVSSILGISAKNRQSIKIYLVTSQNVKSNNARSI